MSDQSTTKRYKVITDEGTVHERIEFFDEFNKAWAYARLKNGGLIKDLNSVEGQPFTRWYCDTFGILEKFSD